MQGFFRRYILLHRALISKLNELLGAYGLSYSQWTVLYYVKNNGSSTLVDIANYYNVKKPVITRTVQSLEEKLIVQQIPGTDKREKLIQLTELGDDIYKVCRHLIDELEANVMEGISDKEKKVVSEILPKIRDNLINVGGSNNA